MAVTPIGARCRRCGEDFHLFEVREQRSGCCPRCGWVLTPDWTAKLLEEAGRADFAQRHLVAALRSLRNLPGNVDLRPHTILRNLFEEVGWEQELADNPEMLREELRELRRLVSAWELLDPVVATAQPRRNWLSRAVAVLTGASPAPQFLQPLDDGSLTDRGDLGQIDRTPDITHDNSPSVTFEGSSPSVSSGWSPSIRSQQLVADRSDRPRRGPLTPRSAGLRSGSGNRPAWAGGSRAPR